MACLQVKRCSELADEALRDGMCIVIGLQVCAPAGGGKRG
jgi:hypothetical protein